MAGEGKNRRPGNPGERHDEHKRQTKSFQDFTATLPANGLPFDGCGGSDPLRHYGRAPEPPPVVLSSTALGGKQNNHRVPIAYATYAGSTQEVAVEIGRVLGERGFGVDVIPVVENPQVDGYHFVLIGSAVHGSRWCPRLWDLSRPTRRRSIVYRRRSSAFACLAWPRMNITGSGVRHHLWPGARLCHSCSRGAFRRQS